MDPHGLLHSAQIARRQGRLVDAHRDLTQAVAMLRQSGSKSDLIGALKALGQIERDGGDHAAALDVYEEAATLCRGHCDALLLAHTLRHVADIHQDVGESALALPYYEEAVALYRANLPTPLEFANALRPYALVKLAMGDTGAARALLTEAREFYIDAGVYAGANECAQRLAHIAP